MKNYKFLITIPTLNSDKTIDECLISITQQKYKNYSCNVVDSYSSDNTIKIVKEKNIKFKMYKGKLLGARYLGFIDKKCDYVIFIDSDQVIDKTLLERLNTLLNYKKPDMVILEEHSYKTKTWIEKMYNLDRSIIHKEIGYNISPIRGVLLPRVFKKELLIKAFKNIDSSLFTKITAHDHAIIYYECSQISNNIAYIKNAVFHQEPNSLLNVFWHFVNYGKNTRSFLELKLYDDLIYNKMNGRNKGLLINLFSKKIYTLPLLITKGLGYYYGFWLKKKQYFSKISQ